MLYCSVFFYFDDNFYPVDPNNGSASNSQVMLILDFTGETKPWSVLIFVWCVWNYEILYVWVMSPEADVCCIYGVRPASIYNAEGHFRSEALMGIISETCAVKMGFAPRLDHKYYAMLRHTHNKWHSGASRDNMFIHTHAVKGQLITEF